MLLKTEFEKNTYLKSCLRHIDRIKKSMSTSSEPISSDKIKVLSRIYEKVSKENVTGASINLKEIYKNTKRELATEISGQYPIDILMKKQRGWIFRTFLGYLLNLIWPMPTSAVFLNKTGFFDVTEDNHITQSSDNRKTHSYKSTNDKKSLTHDVEEERSDNQSKALGHHQPELIESKQTKAANLVAHSYRYYKHMKTVPSLKVEQYPKHLIPKFRNKKNNK